MIGEATSQSVSSGPVDWKLLDRLIMKKASVQKQSGMWAHLLVRGVLLVKLAPKISLHRTIVLCGFVCI